MRLFMTKFKRILKILFEKESPIDPEPDTVIEEVHQVSSERKEFLHNVIRNNIIDSIDFMLFNNYFNFHQDENMFKLHLNMLYFDYIIDSIDPDLLVEVDDAIKCELEEHINQKRNEKEISKCTWN